MEDLVSRISKQIGHLLLLAPAVMLSQVGDDIPRHGNLGTTDCPPLVTLNQLGNNIKQIGDRFQSCSTANYWISEVIRHPFYFLHQLCLLFAWIYLTSAY